jgi:hypothetical protein
MATAKPRDLSTLYEQDETAWLEIMAALAADRRFSQMDFPHLSEYLTDMAKRDRREVFSRLVALLAQLLKWEHQPDRRSGSWQATILEQQRELRQLVESWTLRNHAVAVLSDAFDEARKQAAAESGLGRNAFPDFCPWNLEQALTDRGDL